MKTKETIILGDSAFSPHSRILLGTDCPGSIELTYVKLVIRGFSELHVT